MQFLLVLCLYTEEFKRQEKEKVFYWCGKLLSEDYRIFFLSESLPMYLKVHLYRRLEIKYN